MSGRLLPHRYAIAASRRVASRRVDGVEALRHAIDASLVEKTGRGEVHASAAPPLTPYTARRATTARSAGICLLRRKPSPRRD